MRRKKPSAAHPPGKQASASDAAPHPRRPVRYDPDEAPPKPDGLTTGEGSVHYWVVRGKDNTEIAKILGGNPGTIRKHVENIRRKVGAESRLAVIAGHWLREVEERDRVIRELRRRLSDES